MIISSEDESDYSVYLRNIRERALEDMDIVLDFDSNIVDDVNTGFMCITDTNIQSIFPGQVFVSNAVLKDSITLYSIKKNFQFRVYKSCPKQYWLSCVDQDCSWYLKASTRKDSGVFVIREYDEVHTCSVAIRKGEKRQVSRSIVGKYIKDSFLREKRVYTVGDIITDIRNRLGSEISYSKAWQGKEYALNLIRGSPSESYNKIPSFLYILQATNPGSVVKFEKRDDKFLYLFVAMQASIQGFAHCHPVVVVDATFLNSCYGGSLISASTPDAAGKVFPLAYAIADGENDASWEWFFKQFFEVFKEREGMVIVSDRQQSIQKACRKVYPNVPHCVCTYHLMQNMKAKFRSNTEDMCDYFKRAYNAYSIKDFDQNMLLLDSIDKRIRPYLVEAGFERWSRVHSLGRRYTTMTSNIAESLNSMIKEAKLLPIIPLFDFMRGMLQDLFYRNRNLARNTRTTLVRNQEDVLSKQYDLAATMEVLPSTDHLVSVSCSGKKYVVDIDARTCTCNRFQFDGIPFAHDCAFLKKSHLDPYAYYFVYYTKEKHLATYGGTVFPIPLNGETFIIPEEVREQVVFPPDTRNKPGRPRKNRFKQAWEGKPRTKVKCSVCNKLGHNRRTCGGVVTE